MHGGLDRDDRRSGPVEVGNELSKPVVIVAQFETQRVARHEVVLEVLSKTRAHLNESSRRTWDVPCRRPQLWHDTSAGDDAATFGVELVEDSPGIAVAGPVAHLPEGLCGIREIFAEALIGMGMPRRSGACPPLPGRA
jgi:hypothetical protein